MLIARKGVQSKGKIAKGGGGDIDSGGGGSSTTPVNTTGWYVPLVDSGFDAANPTFINRETNVRIAMTQADKDNRTRVINGVNKSRNASYFPDNLFAISKKRDTYPNGRYLHPAISQIAQCLVATGDPQFADFIAEFATNMGPNFYDGWTLSSTGGTLASPYTYRGIVVYADDGFENMVDEYQGDPIYGRDIGNNEQHIWYTITTIAWVLEANRGQVSPKGYDYAALANRFHYLSKRHEDKWYHRKGIKFPTFPSLGAGAVQMWTGHLKQSLMMADVENRRGDTYRSSEYLKRVNYILPQLRRNDHVPYSKTDPYPGGWYPWTAPSGKPCYLWASGTFRNGSPPYSTYELGAQHMVYVEQFAMYYTEAMFLIGDPQGFDDLTKLWRTIAEFATIRTPAQMTTANSSTDPSTGLPYDQESRPFHEIILGRDTALGDMETYYMYSGKHHRTKPSVRQVAQRSYAQMAIFDETGKIDAVIKRAQDLSMGTDSLNPLYTAYPAMRLFKAGYKAVFGVDPGQTTA